MISDSPMRKNSIFILFVMLAAITLAGAEPILMQEGTTYANHLYQMNGKIYYRFNIGDSFPANEDLVVITVPTHIGADPDIFISTTKPEPQNRQDSEVACSHHGYEVCVLPSENVKPNSSVYIAVYCMYWCDFEVTVKFSKAVELTAPDETPIYLDKTGFKQIKVKVPPSEAADHIYFHVNYNNIKNASTMLNMFLNKGDIDPTSSSFALSGVPAWNDGTVIPISKGNGQFCLNCSYSILVHGEPNSALLFKAQVSHETYDIKLNVRYDDTLGYNGVLYYKLEFSNETLEILKNQTLNFELVPYLGNPDLFVNPGTKPALWSQYALGANSTVGESLTLTPRERNLSNPVYYIAVHSDRTATFSLIVYTSSKNGKKIKFGMSETGYIQPAEIVNFFLDIPVEQDDLKVEASLFNVFGYTELFFKKCPNQSGDCEITGEEIKASKGGNAPQIYSGWHQTAENKVSFLHNSTECQAKEKNYCRYVAAVAAAGNTTSRYQFIVYYKEKHIILRNSIPVKGSLEVGEEAHYRFTLPDDQFVASVIFQLTPISGIPQIYSSKTSLYPTTTQFDRAACGCSNLILYCGRSQTDIPLKATYYLMVHAFTHTVYTITPYIMAWGFKSVLELHQSQPQKFVFRNNTEPAYFKFSIPSSELAHENLRISLTPINGRFHMYLGQEFIPDPNKTLSYFGSTDSNTIIIDHKTREILKDNNFYITVVPQNAPANADEAASKLQFTILYTPQTGITRLQEGHPQDVRLTKNEPQFFQYNANQKDELLKFSTTIFSGEVSIYISATENYPTVSNYDFSANKSTLYGIEIDNGQLIRKCNTNSSNICTLYIGVYPENNEDAQLSLSITKNMTMSSIQDGVPLDFLLPRQGKRIHFYAYSNDEPFYVEVSSDSPLKIFASIVDISKTPSIVDWVFPDANNSVALEKVFGEKYSTLINPRGCKDCILGITISSVDEPASQKKGTLLVTTHARKLQSGTSFVDIAKGASYRYYNFELSDSSPSATVYLTPLGSCNPELYLIQGRDQLPSKNNFSWSSNDTVAPSIRVDPQQLPTGVSKTQGYYNLAVYNEKSVECTFSLTFSSQNIKFLGLKTGVPQELDLLPGQSDVYLAFVDHSNQPIKIMVARDVGESNLFVKTLAANTNRSVALPNENDNSYNTKSIYSKDFIHIPRRSGANSLCEYIINVQNNEKDSNSKLSLIVSSEGSFTQLYPGKTYRDFVNSTSINRYAYTQGSLKEEEIELTLTVYSGEPTLFASSSAQISDSNYRWKETSVTSKASAGPKVISVRITRGSGQSSDIKENDPIYYLVTSKTDSYFDVTLKAANKNTILQAGKFVEGSLQPHQDRSFTFLTPNDLPLEEDKFFTLSIISLTDSTSPPQLKVTYAESTNQGSNEMIVVPDYEKVVGNVRNLNLPRKKGAYKFIVTNFEDKPIKYSLIFNYRNEVYLPLNTPVYDTVSKTKTQHYRIYIEKKGQLQLEIYHCYGQATFLLEKENRESAASSIPNHTPLLVPYERK